MSFSRRRRPERSASDSGVTRPTTVRWPPPARRTTEPVGPPHQRPPSPSRASSTEGDSPPIQTSDSPNNEATPRVIHTRAALRQETPTVALQRSRSKDLPPTPPMPIAQTSLHDTAHSPGSSTRHQHGSQEARLNIGRQASRHGRSTDQHNETTSRPIHHRSHSTSSAHHVSHHHSIAHQSSRRRPHSRPPSANSHRYASSPVYPPSNAEDNLPMDHGATRGEHGYHNVLTKVHTTSSSHHPNPVEPAPSHTTHKLHEPQHHTPDPTRISGISPMPGLHSNMDQEFQTRYVRMLLALDNIPPLYNLLASFFTWILLAGFILFPGTFASWKDEPSGSTLNTVVTVINHVPLLVIAWLCTGVGGCGMIWLWWRWQSNYIWLVNQIFVPGLLNSFTGVISTLTNVYGSQNGVFSSSAKSTIIVTGALAVICALLVLGYHFGLIRNLRLEHEREVGVEKAGRHGEGILGEKKRGIMET